MARKTLALLVGGWALVAQAQAQAGDGAVTVTVENDFFTASDNNYTNGIGVAWVSDEITAEEDCFVGRWTQFWSFLPYVADDGYRTYAAWSVVQEMNTPDDITEANPSEDDQPYSGVLYVDSTLYAKQGNWTHAWQLKLGVVGPASGAGDVQREFHKLIGDDKPQGWHTQLPNEPVVNIDYTVAHLAAAGRVGQSAQWRLVPMATAGIGNYFTGVGGGVYAETGWNLLEALGVTALRSGLNTASTVGVKASDNWSVSFYGGVAAYGVVHYLPLDGTLFRHSRSVSSEPLIGMASFGACLRRRGFTLSYSKTFFTDTFETQRQNTNFGTVGVSWMF
ncbi:lipid A deacylase LpxR family protein [Rheinheimera muenzenbergensis]|uniref:Lipid A deacylase LpxR family protein n=1 Tax=Rheinheimera muenzenbergensis TaxID=1193628 RepID=A0ABU8C1G5_9GAMM